MKAIVYHGNKDIRLENVPEPVPGNSEVKIRVELCGICATDIEEYEYGPNFIVHDVPHPLTGKTLPIITGHELTGTVVETASDVTNVDIGERVVIFGCISCLDCWWCRNDAQVQCQSAAFVGFGRDGGLAEYITWPSSHVVSVPDSVSVQESALAEPAAVAHHAVYRGSPSPNDFIAVLGVGPVGILVLQIAKSIGARVCAIDKRSGSLDLAKDLGADLTINSGEKDVVQVLKDHSDGVGPDIVIDAAGGMDTARLSVEAVRSGGKVILVAIYTNTPNFDFNSIVSKEVEILGSLGYNKYDLNEAIRLISLGSVKTKPLVSDVIGLEEVIDVGFARMLNPDKDFFRILVSPR